MKMQIQPKPKKLDATMGDQIETEAYNIISLIVNMVDVAGVLNARNQSSPSKTD